MEQKPSISFGFKKKVEQKETKRIILDRDVIEDREEQELIFSVEGDIIKSSKPETVRKGDLIIPLIKTNKWNDNLEEHLKFLNDENTKTDKVVKDQSKNISGDDIDSVAARELIAEAARENEKQEAGSAINNGISIPLLLQNKVPEGFETDEKLDVSLRPNEAKVADYDSVPIEAFGKAVLRGMGWSDGEGIGKRKTNPLLPIDAVLRPKGLGLGADRSQASSKKSSIKESSKSEKKLSMKSGTCCVVIKGQYKDRYGTIEGVDEDNVRVVVKLVLGKMNVTLSQSYIKLVDQKEFDQYSKYLNKGKSDEFKIKNDKRLHEEQKLRHKNKDDQVIFHERLHGEEYQRSMSEQKRSIDSSKYDQNKKMKYNSDSNSHQKPCWLFPNLQVRIIDKTYKKGNYYKRKVIIEDVISELECICRTEENKVLEGISQSILETVIPRSDQSYIMVVNGKYKGKVAELISRNKTNCTADVILLQNRDVTLNLDYDSICAYIPRDDFDIDN